MSTRTLRSIASATNQSVEWVVVNANDRKTLQALKRTYGYHEADILDAAPPLQSTKLAVRDSYLFLILLYPVYDKKTRIINTAEIDFFIEKDRIVTVDPVGLLPLQQLYDRFQSGEMEKVYDVPHLLHAMLETLIDSIYPMLRHMAVDVESLEDRLFKNFQRSLIKDLLRIKMNIVNVRKAMQGHKSAIRKLVAEAYRRYVTVVKLQEYFDRLVEETKDIWDRLELQKDTIDALHETNVSLLDYQTNEVMKTLTMFSVVVFPLTLVAAIFGMNAVGMPLVSHPYGFWIILGLMVLVIAVMVWMFRKKRWL